MKFYSLLLSRRTREPNFIHKMHVELIGVSPMWIACKTAKLFTCLGGSSQFRQSIAQTLQYVRVEKSPLLKKVFYAWNVR